MTKYSELLRDPRWQKMCLKALERDDWTCQLCSRKVKTLHVHHCYYEGWRKPWEYPTESLLTLCLDCHEGESANYQNILTYDEHPLISSLMKAGFLQSDIEAFAWRIFCYEKESGEKYTRSRFRDAIANIFSGVIK